MAIPRLLDGPDIEVRGYPMEMALAEKIVTAVQRGTASTRWRDFGDIWTLSHNHTLRGTDIQEAIEQVAAHREADLSALETALVGYADLAQTKWAQWKRKLKLDQLPDEFAEVSQPASSSPTRHCEATSPKRPGTHRPGLGPDPAFGAGAAGHPECPIRRPLARQLARATASVFRAVSRAYADLQILRRGVMALTRPTTPAPWPTP